MAEHSFTLADAEGVDHRYTVTRHRASEGAPLAAQVLGLVVEPLATAAGQTVTAGIGKASKAGLSGMAAFQAIVQDPETLESLDLARIGKAAAMVLMAAGNTRLQLAILAYTNRDGKPLVQGGGFTSAFDEAYAANYTELGRALFEVCRVNGFFPALGMLADVGRKAAALMQETPENNDSNGSPSGS